jgi:hypothetical protein
MEVQKETLTIGNKLQLLANTNDLDEIYAFDVYICGEYVGRAYSKCSSNHYEGSISANINKLIKFLT